MSWLTRLIAKIPTPETKVYREGWVFDGEKVVLDDMLLQNKSGITMEFGGRLVPPEGGKLWLSPACRDHVHEDHIFDSKQEAARWAIRKTKDRIAALLEVQRNLERSL
jgi:hypothetical protein